jgi:putative hydrolase of the HAD superfamily
MQTIRALSIDLDNTLWDVEPVIVAAERILHAHLAERYPRMTELYGITEMRALRLRMAEEHPDVRHDLTFLRKAALRRQATSAGYDADVAEEAFEIFYAARNAVEPYADVVPSLERLNRELRLVAVTNGNADLDRIGLANFFEFSLAAGEVGVAKPDPRIFAVALERAALPAAAVLHVGDDPVADVEGARAAGLGTVWMNRTNAVWPDSLVPADYEVSDLRELADLVLRTSR